jgi:hypothetical protein
MLAFYMNSALQLGCLSDPQTFLSSPLYAQTRLDHPRSFFSCTYELPILQSLCFDIHASDGGCRGYSQPFDVQTFRRSIVQRSISFLLTLFRTLLHFFALFCTYAKLNSFRFKQFRTLSQKHRGVGGTASAACSELLGVGWGPSGNRWQPSPANMEVSSPFRADFCFLWPGLFQADHRVRFLEGTSLYHFDVASSRSRGLQ